MRRATHRYPSPVVLDMHRMGIALVAVVMSGCIAGPHDWTGGFSGDYDGTLISTSETTSNGATTKVTSDVSAAVRIESGSDKAHGFVFNLPCVAVPVTWSPMGLSLEGKPECETSTSGGGTTSGNNIEWKKLDVTREGPMGIRIAGEYETKPTSTGAGQPGVTKVAFTGNRVGGE